MPSTEIVHDRTNLEIFRGCIRGCRFCQAGFCYRPVRAKSRWTCSVSRQCESLERLRQQRNYAREPCRPPTIRKLAGAGGSAAGLLRAARRSTFRCPRLRADNFSRRADAKVQKVRKSGLTFAPEAGTQRLRDAINKNVTEDEILQTCAHGVFRRLEQREALFHAGPADRDGRGRGRRLPSWPARSSTCLAGRMPTNKKRRSVHQPGDGLFCAEALYAVPVGGADHAGGISAAACICCKASSDSRSIDYRYHEIRPQQSGGGSGARRPAASDRSCCAAHELGVQARRLGRIFPL